MFYRSVKCVDGPADILHQVARLEDSVQGEMLQVLVTFFYPPPQKKQQQKQ